MTRVLRSKGIKNVYSEGGEYAILLRIFRRKIVFQNFLPKRNFNNYCAVQQRKENINS